MSKSADHLPHCGKPLALDDLLCELLLDGDIAHGNNHAAELGMSVEERTCGSAHGSPAAITMACLVLAKPEHLASGTQIAIERLQFGRGSLSLIEFLPYEVFWFVAEQVTDTGADETIALVEVDHQNQVR